MRWKEGFYRQVLRLKSGDFRELFSATILTVSSPASPAPQAPAAPPPPDKPTFPFDAFEKAAKAFVLLVAVAYAVGLIVSMQHLMSLGISDFSSLRPKYIATGSWTLLLFLLASLPALLPSVAVVVSRAKWNRRNAVGALSLFLVGIAIALTLQHFLLRALGLPSRPVIPREVQSLTYTVSIFTWMCFWFWADSEGRRAARAYLIIVAFYFIPTWVFLAARDYIQAIYRQVPEALGGGKPMTGELILNKDGVTFWRQTGIPLASQSDSTKTQRVKILYQSDQELVVRATYEEGKQTKEKMVILKKSLVDGILPIPDDQN